MSFIDMPAEDVKKIARLCLEHIRKVREEDRLRAIAQERRRYERWANSWLGRLFRVRVPSDEEIESSFDMWTNIHITAYGWGSEDTAKKLLKLAERADVVRVSAKDLDMIA